MLRRSVARVLFPMFGPRGFNRLSAIVETGTYLGGSALLFGQLCDLVGAGQVITIDIQPGRVSATRACGSSWATRPIQRSSSRSARPARRVMVVLDSDHSAAHVLNELQAYSRFESDRSREKFLPSYFPERWLRRIR